MESTYMYSHIIPPAEGGLKWTCGYATPWKRLLRWLGTSGALVWRFYTNLEEQYINNILTIINSILAFSLCHSWSSFPKDGLETKKGGSTNHK